jgi:hypothetical protein
MVPKFYYRVHKSLPLVPIQNQMNLVYNGTVIINAVFMDPLTTIRVSRLVMN